MIDAIHFDMLQTHGGPRGLRDEAVLESALARPRWRFEYESVTDLAALAAAYGFGIARSHPFNDGNKRVAFVTMGVFLGLNGMAIEAPEPEVVSIMLDLAAGTLTEDELADWLRSHTVAGLRDTSG